MKTLDGTYRTIVRFQDGIEIKANLGTWILFVPPRDYSYFPSLDFLIDSLFDYRIKSIAIKSGKQTLKSLSESIQKARDEIFEIIGELTSIKIPKSGRLQAQGGMEGGGCGE